MYPGSLFGIGPGFSIFPIGSAVRRTEYVLGGPGAVWSESLFAASSDDNPFGGEVVDGDRLYPPGSVRSVDWLRGPLAPGFADQTNGFSTFPCVFCRTASKLSVFLSPVTDTEGGHLGFLDPSPKGSPVARFRIYENGRLIADENDVRGGVFTVPAGSTTYRIVSDVTRRWSRFAHSTDSTTDLTFVSAAGQGGRLPAGWQCTYFDAGACRTLPMLRIQMPLPTDLMGTLPLGVSAARFSVTHVPGAPTSDITAASVQTSVDGGKTWHAAPTTRVGNHRFQVALNNSVAGRQVSLRISAKDAVGGAITETVLNAYSVASS